MHINLQRAYDAPTPTDGYRVLVDRLWPRGVKKELLALDEWCKDVAPSTELREWFEHDAAKLAEFTARYQVELQGSAVPRQLLQRAAAKGKLTLIYAAKDPAVNHAVVLCDYLQHLAA